MRLRVWVTIGAWGAAAAVSIGLTSPPASATSDPAPTAIAWAQRFLNTTTDDGLCLQFVASAYQSAGVNIGSVGSKNGASDYWSKDPAGYTRHPGDTSPPAGALVFWGASDVGGTRNPYGHVGIFVGSVSGQSASDEVISTASWPVKSVVHYFSLSARNAHGYPYLGWMAPPGVSNGGYEMAFQANTGNLVTVGTAGGTNWGQGMLSGTSPSIANLQ